MKKLIFILLFLLTISCNKDVYITKNVYEKTYDTKEIAQIDLDYKLSYYNIDIPVNQWIVNDLSNDTISIQQKIVRKIINDKSSYQVILSRYTYPYMMYYQLVIRYSGNIKDLKN